MRVAGIPLGVIQNIFNWEVDSVLSFTKTEGANGAMLLTSSDTGASAVTAKCKNKFTGAHTLQAQFTNNNEITANTLLSGISLVLFIESYNASNVYLDRVGFFVVFTNVSSAPVINVSGATGNGTFAASKISNQNTGDTLDSDIIYSLFFDTTTKNWGWSSSDGASYDGDSLIGQLHANTAHVRFSAYMQINTGVTGTAEINVLSIS